LLTPASLERYLGELGIRHAGGARELSGGVSNVVLHASTPDGDLVVKQSLPRLNVAEEWLASQERTIREAAALRVASAGIPGSVPEVIALDEQRYVLVIQAAPLDWANWKQQLLAGEVDERTAVWLGRWLGRWQRLARGEGSDPFADNDVFLQLRVDPYYRVAAARNADLGPVIDDYVASMLATRRCLVHGDFSPKNVLVGGGGERWVIDFEVVHVGDPVFDVAFMLNHLVLKSLHRARLADELRRCASAFLTAYEAEAPRELVPERRYLAGHLGCLMLARVDGKSPAEYLTADERELAGALARRLLASPPVDVDETWAMRDEVCAAH
jgi:5-methylthioribose kinase